MSLYVAGLVGVTGVGAPLAAAIGFVAIDNLQAGARSMWTNQHTPTYDGELIEWSGLLPKGYGEIAYSLVDIGLVGKAASVLKTATQTQNVIKLQTTKTVEKISLNQKNVIELKNSDEISILLNASLIANDDPLAKAAEWIKPQNDYFDVVIHGSSDSFSVFHNGKWVNINQRALTTFVQKIIITEKKSD